MQKTNTDKKENKQWQVILILIILLFLMAGIFVIYLIRDKQVENTSKFSNFDTNAVKSINKSDYGDTQQYLNAIANKTAQTLCISSDIVFETSGSEGLASITNKESNVLAQQVSIVENSSGDVIYDSDLLKPGDTIEKITLSKKLPKGEYKCTAYFTGVDIGTKQAVGKSGANITIKINN